MDDRKGIKCLSWFFHLKSIGVLSGEKLMNQQ
jgi:hypothetical protein